MDELTRPRESAGGQPDAMLPGSMKPAPKGATRRDMTPLITVLTPPLELWSPDA